MAQWMLGIPHATAYMGAVGVDEHGAMLEKCATEDGVLVHYQKNSSTLYH